MASFQLKRVLLVLFISSLIYGCATPGFESPPKTSQTTNVQKKVSTSTRSTVPAEKSVAFLDNQTDLESDLWDRIRHGYAIPDLDNALVTDQLNWYSSRTAYLLRTTERASLYLYHVVEELEKRGMPTELALLPFIESAFNPQAISSARAAGMWQFIPSTGRDFNLRQNIFQDERRDVLDSTDAALSYLQKLYDMFGDWQLALAAYNWGEGSVQRAIKKQQAANLPVDFNSMLYLMPKETQNYVPKLQAVKRIISNPELFNLPLPRLENQPYFVIIDKTRDIDIQVAAQLAELTVAEFKQLNPQFNRPIITGSADTKILLPADNAEIYKNNLSQWQGPLASWTAYTVSKNERIENIAQRIGTQASILKEINQIPANMMVKAGSTLLIPKTSQTGDNDIAQHILDNANLTFTREDVKKISLTTTKKDSLASVAKRYKVTVAQIKQWNNLTSDKLKTGQKLQLEVALTSAKRSNSRAVKKVAAKKVKVKSTVAAKQTKKLTVAQVRAHKAGY